MPFLAIINPQVPEGHQDEFLAALNKIAPEMKAQPGVLGVSAGPIVAEDGVPVTGFKYLETIAFATQEDEQAFVNSEWAQGHRKALEAKGVAPPRHGVFRCAEFPDDKTPKAFTQFSRIALENESQIEAAKEAWKELMGVLGKETWGARSVEGDEVVGLGLCGWDSLEEASAAYSKPEAKAAIEKYHSLGKCKDVMVKMAVL
ncbi:hypothetical protein BDZ45DRAFT_349512 [Acephala macrosclerotiorum]|nr:hypothetical protein BDZ45DRAFT_349512 [Acephala macrosclerotiorum]